MPSPAGGAPFCAVPPGAPPAVPAVVSAVGVVGWVGLIVPHAARLLVGPNFPRLFPMSLLLGALFLALVDTASRAFTAFEVPLGVITALLGGPVFLALLMRRGGVSA